MVEHIRLIFIDVKKYEVTDSFNKKAGELFKSNVDEFFIKVGIGKCRLGSAWRHPRPKSTTMPLKVRSKYYDVIMQFLPFNERHKKIKDSLTQICEDQSLSQ